MIREGFKNQMCSLFKSLRFFNIVILMFCFTTSSSWPIGVGVTLLMTPLWIMSIYDTYKAKLASAELDKEELDNDISTFERSLDTTRGMLTDTRIEMTLTKVSRNGYLAINYNRLLEDYSNYLEHYESIFVSKGYRSHKDIQVLLNSRKYRSMSNEALESIIALQQIQKELLILLKSMRSRTKAKTQKTSPFIPREVLEAMESLNISPNILKDISAKDFKSKIFRPLVKRYHPDNGGSTDRFQEVQINLSILERYLKRVS